MTDGCGESHTHARMVLGSRCMRDAHVLVRLEKSENIITRYHD